MIEKRKSFRTLSEDLKSLRRRQVPQGEIDRFNKIMEEEEMQERGTQKGIVYVR